jgi:hypothetical protein
MSIGEHQHSSFFQKIQLNNLFLFSQSFSYSNPPNQQADGVMNVFQFVDFDGLNIYFGFIDYSTNTVTAPAQMYVYNSSIVGKASIPPRDLIFGIYKATSGNDVDFSTGNALVKIKPAVFATAGGTPI